jgi:UDP-N-acetylmuramate dehydrogenase
MVKAPEVASRLANLPGVRVERDALLKQHTRFGIGGPALVLADASNEAAFEQSVRAVRESLVPWVVIGGGTNLVVSDEGYPGVVLRYTSNALRREGTQICAESGAVLQMLVDFSIAEGLGGIHTMTGIPGWVGGAVYGNAGAYGRSMHQNVVSVRFFDGEAVREFDNEACGFRYRHSAFKDNKNWTVLSTVLQLAPWSSAELKEKADGILGVRNAKYPPTMKCAGSIFKNLLFAELPETVRKIVDPAVVREGKVPSAWFLEQVGAKGLRNGDIHVADYHANLIYNGGAGTARQVREVIDDLKARVRERFSFDVEEEVQYVP